MPARHPKRGRLWLNDGSCIRLRPAYGNHVWAYDFVFERTREGRPLKFLTVVDEFTRKCLAIEVARKQSSREVLRMLAALMLRHGIPKHIRSDNGSEFVGHSRPGVALEVGDRDVVHRAGESVGERLHRKLQRETQE